MTIKTQEELSQEKAPKMNRNIIGETQIERSEKCRREKTASFIRIMQKILSAIKITVAETEKYIIFLIKTLPTLLKPTDTILDDLNLQIKNFRGVDILTYYTHSDPAKEKEHKLNRRL